MPLKIALIRLCLKQSFHELLDTFKFVYSKCRFVDDQKKALDDGVEMLHFLMTYILTSIQNSFHLEYDDNRNAPMLLLIT